MSMREYVGVDTRQQRLGNGLTLLTNVKPTGTVTLSITVRVGSFHERDHQGIAHLVEHLVFKGTEKRTVDEINEAIEDVGGILNAETTFEYTRYYCTVPSDAWQVGLDVLCDIVFNATIPVDEFDREKTVVQEEISMYDDDPSSYVNDQLFKAIYQNYPSRQTIAGTRNSVGAISRQDVVDFITDYYVSQNIFVIAAGDIDPKAIVTFLQRYPVKQGGVTPPLMPFKGVELNMNLTTDTRHIEQAHLAWGLIAPKAQATDAAAASVYAAVLGGTMTSRLYRLIREQRGLAYTVSTSYLGFSDTGLILGYTGLAQQHVEMVSELIVEEFERLRYEVVSPTELNRVKASITGIFLITLERTSSLVSFLNNAVILGLSLDPNIRIREVENVSAPMLTQVAQTYVLPSNWQFSTILPNS